VEERLELFRRPPGQRRPDQPPIAVEDDDVEPPPHRHVDPDADHHPAIVAALFTTPSYKAHPSGAPVAAPGTTGV
jgi:hypothetical protein